MHPQKANCGQGIGVSPTLTQRGNRSLCFSWKDGRDQYSRIGQRDLCRQRGMELLEGHLMQYHVHMYLRVPPKFSIAFEIGFLKGKSAVRIHRSIGNRRVTGLHFWSRGYCVSTVV